MNKILKRLSYIALLSTVSANHIHATLAGIAVDEPSTAAKATVMNYSYADVRAILPPTPQNLESLECIETGYKGIFHRLASTGISKNVAAYASGDDRSYLNVLAEEMSHRLHYLTGVSSPIYYLHSAEDHGKHEQSILNKLYAKYSAATAAATSPISASAGAGASS